jgi:pimeloyl-ACP methyl ester carboxylesterase|tara:strand:- start:5068 stop:5937 length:870 start_codon:yes stop_codon:yes gene_type:complete
LSNSDGYLHANRLKLAQSSFGDPAAPPIIFAHGGGQTRHAWRGAAKALAFEGYRSIALDLRGHGESDWAADGDYSLEAIARDLIEVGERVAGGGGRPHIVGASLGGLAAIVAAGVLSRNAFASVTLVDIAPNMDAAGVAKVVEFMGAHIEEGFDSLEQAADVIATYLPHRPRPKDMEGLRKNLRQDNDGRWRWHWDPAFITGVMRRSAIARTGDLEQAVRDIRVPLHLIRGRMSELVSEDSVTAFRSLAPQAHFTDVAGARHMVAGDRNDVFTEAVASFLRQIREETPA